jgi:hypothetical protein
MSMMQGTWIGAIITIAIGISFLLFIASNEGQITIVKNYKGELDQCKADLAKQVDARTCQCDCKSPVWSTMFLWLAAILFYAHALYMHSRAQDKEKELNERERQLIKRRK